MLVVSHCKTLNMCKVIFLKNEIYTNLIHKLIVKEKLQYGTTIPDNLIR